MLKTPAHVIRTQLSLKRARPAPNEAQGRATRRPCSLGQSGCPQASVMGGACYRHRRVMVLRGARQRRRLRRLLPGRLSFCESKALAASTSSHQPCWPRPRTQEWPSPGTGGASRGRLWLRLSWCFLYTFNIGPFENSGQYSLCAANPRGGCKGAGSFYRKATPSEVTAHVHVTHAYGQAWGWVRVEVGYLYGWMPPG